MECKPQPSCCLMLGGNSSSIFEDTSTMAFDNECECRECCLNS